MPLRKGIARKKFSPKLKAPRKKWSQEDMDEAFKACKLEGVRPSVAARLYNVPRRTLSDRLSGKVKKIVHTPLPRKSKINHSDNDSDSDEGMNIEEEEMSPVDAVQAKIGPPLVTITDIADCDKEQSSSPTLESQQEPGYAQLSHNHFRSILASLVKDERFVDVTLTAEGHTVKAHKSMLAAMSPYFKSVLSDNPCHHPVIVMPANVLLTDLVSIINYIYKGEITVDINQLPSLLQTAEILQITSLIGAGSSIVSQNTTDSLQPNDDSMPFTEENACPQPCQSTKNLSKIGNCGKTTIVAKMSPSTNLNRKLTTSLNTNENSPKPAKQNVHRDLETDKTPEKSVGLKIDSFVEEHVNDSPKGKRHRKTPKHLTDFVTTGSTVFIPYASSSTSKRGTTTKDKQKSAKAAENHEDVDVDVLAIDTDNIKQEEGVGSEASSGNFRCLGRGSHKLQEYRYQCPFCERVVRCPAELKRHIRTHTGEKPFKCAYCDFHTAQKGNLNSHVLSEHPMMFGSQYGGEKL